MRQYQQRLVELGYYSGMVDGKYSTATQSAVTEFQSRNGLTADGAAGSGTGDMLASVYDAAGKQAQIATAAELEAHTGDATIHVGSADRAAWDEAHEMAGAVNEALIEHAQNADIHVTAGEKATWSGKQDALTFDDAPAADSANPVKSGGIYTALSGKEASGTAAGLLNRTNAVNLANTNYAAYMARGESLNAAATTPTANGAIAWTYGAGLIS